DTFGRIGEQLHRESDFDVLGKNEDADIWILLPDHQGRPHPFIGVGRRQPDVDDDRIGRVLCDAYQQLIGCAAARRNLDVGDGQQLRDALAQQHTVLGDGYPHGISARTRVPLPTELQTRRWPLSASIRSASPRSPVPRSLSAPPIPSSTISTIKVSVVTPTSTVTVSACACLAAFVRLSETT